VILSDREYIAQNVVKLRFGHLMATTEFSQRDVAFQFFEMVESDFPAFKQ
jgi:hypothetical protein